MNTKQILLWNRILLGLVMLVAGVMKLFVMGPDAIVGMLSGIGLFSWAPTFWAWVLILAEIFAGISILAKWKMKIGTSLAAIIVIVAAFTLNLDNIGNLLMHLALATNYLYWGSQDK